MTAYQSMANGGFYEEPDFYGFTFQDFEGMNYSDRLCYANTIKKLTATEDDSLCYVGDTYTSDQFWSVLGVVGTAEVLAVESSRNYPVLVANNYGRGRVYLGLTEWMLDENNNMMDFYADVIRSVILNSAPDVFAHAAIENGTSDFSYQVSKRTLDNGVEQMLILVSHYGLSDGYVTLDFNRFLDITADAIKIEVCGGAGYDTFTSTSENGLSVTFKIKAEDVALICIDGV